MQSEALKCPKSPTRQKDSRGTPPGEPSPTIYPPEEVDEETMRRAFDFEPETIRGKPLSQTVIEDRGPEMPDPRDSEGESERPAITRPPKKGRRTFNPVKIGGKPLSETVMEERRNARY